MRETKNGITTKIAGMGMLVLFVVGAFVGYYVGQQSQSSQIIQLQNEVDQLQAQLEARELQGDIVVKGSDTLLIVAQLWAEAFMADYPRVAISVAGGGSGVGFTALIDGTTDIADASREIKASELQSARAAGVNPVEWTVGLDGISIVVHPDNPLSELTMEQLEKIYNGTYTNWMDVGGRDATIITYGRQSTSGTYDFFREHVLHNKNYRADNRELAGNAEIVQTVQGDVNGIGYVGVAYTKQGVSVKILKIEATAAGTAYEPSIANIKSGAYPIARKLYIYTNGIPTGVLAEYVSFILGPEGQRILENIGYVSLAKLER